MKGASTMNATSTLRIPCVLMRGGTSRGLVFRREDLPTDRGEWDAIFLAALGSPDVRQLDGVGAGDSHTSKVAVLHPSEDSGPDGADVDYLFGEVAITEARVDYAANSGNIIAALGLYAVEEGWVPAVDPETSVRVRNLNTGKLIELIVPTPGGVLAEEGDFSIDGVPGEGPRIDMAFPRPEGAVTDRLLPTDSLVERLEVPGLGAVEVTLLDAANPVVLVAGEDLGITPLATVGDLNGDKAFLETVQGLRSAASVAMGLVSRPEDAWGHSPMVPFPVLLFPPADYPRFDDPARRVRAGEVDLCARVISLGRIHKSINVTVSVAITAAALTPGTLANRISQGAAEKGGLRIGHPSGVVHTQGLARPGEDAKGPPVIEWVRMGRTARRIMEGNAVIQPHKLRWIRERMREL